MKKNIIKIITGLLFILFFSACAKEDFDTTPEYVTDWVANTTIADLKAKYATMPALIDTDIVIKGKVVSSDLHGNFHKELFIQDETGAIGIELDNSYLYENYPIGRTVYVKCKGLGIDLDYGVTKLGLGLGIKRISSALIEDYLDINTEINSVKPIVITLDDINSHSIDSLIGCFVCLENVQFADTSGTYYDPNEQYYTEIAISDCSANQVNLSTSAYADFGDETLPKGNGIINAVLSYYDINDVYQLRINSSDDVNFTGKRCTK